MIEKYYESIIDLQSPGFDTSYPQVFNKDLIDSKALHAMERSWLKRHFQPQELRIYSVKNVYVVGDGLVLNTDLQPFMPALWPFSPIDIEKGQTAIRSSLRIGNIKKYDKTTIICKKLGHHNYGHWLIEMLPRAQIVKRMLGEMHDVLVHESSGPLDAIVDRTLEIAGYPEQKIVKTNQDPALFSNLLVVVGLTRHGSYMSPISPLLVNEMSLSIPYGSSSKKIYISRSDKNRRRLVNEGLIREKLEAEGYLTVVPGELSFENQVQIFRSANTVVGTIGAEFSNIVFCQPSTRVITLVPQGMPDTFFWFISQHKKLDYTEIRGATIGDLSGRSWNNSFGVNLDQLLSII